ncbi:hypothetical protein RB195_010847 [Necator americanus]|uniref:Uncharacterized protein n=1 Tax=Necator americanus TaxID=51031 RepID=A0ABR1CZQ6_NECAM
MVDREHIRLALEAVNHETDDFGISPQNGRADNQWLVDAASAAHWHTRRLSCRNGMLPGRKMSTHPVLVSPSYFSKPA